MRHSSAHFALVPAEGFLESTYTGSMVDRAIAVPGSLEGETQFVGLSL